MVAVDLTAVEEPRKEDREKAKSCVHITGGHRFEHFSESFLPSRELTVRSFERETANAFRKTGAILWETARRLGKIITSGYLNRSGEASTNENASQHRSGCHNKFVGRSSDSHSYPNGKS